MSNHRQHVEDLPVWQESMSICQAVYRLLNLCTDRGLRDRMQQAAVAVPLNIAEGFTPRGDKVISRHLLIARQSALELRSLLYMAFDHGYLQKADVLVLLERLRKIAAQLQRFSAVRPSAVQEHV